MPVIYIALLHYPVRDKNGESIISAVTNLDLHDIARAAKTYGVRGFYVVNPYDEQKKLVEKIVSHWVTGYGATYNPERKKALELIRIKESFEKVKDEIEKTEKYCPKVVGTSASAGKGAINCSLLASEIADGTPYILTFGTAWGISENFMKNCDCILEPIRGYTDYNHLSVRSAVSIILDRLVGRR